MEGKCVKNELNPFSHFNELLACDTNRRTAQSYSMYHMHSGRLHLHCLKKNDNDVLRYNFNAHQPILIIFGRDIAD